MGYYSFEVVARDVVGIKDPIILLDTGLNVFTVVTEDVEALCKQLRDEGVTIRAVHSLDGHEPASLVENLLVPGETLDHSLLLTGGEPQLLGESNAEDEEG